MAGSQYDQKRVEAAVRIKIALDRTLSRRKGDELNKDLSRLKAGMTPEELTEYNKRVAR